MTALGISCVAGALSGLLPPDNDNEKDYYDILGIPHNASQDDIDKAFSEQSLALHPDKMGQRGSGTDSKEYRMVQEAHGVLENPRRRRTYHALGCNPTKYKFVTSGGYRNPTALCQNLSHAGFAAKSRIVLLAAIALFLVLLQHLLIVVKILQTCQKEGGDLEYTDWTIILIPLWLMHGTYVLLSLLIASISEHKWEGHLDLYEKVSWLSWEVLMAIRLDESVDWNYIYIFLPCYLAILLRIVQSVTTMRRASKERRRMSSNRTLEQEPLDDASNYQDLNQDEEKPLHKGVQIETDTFHDEEDEVEAVRVHTSPKYHHAMADYYIAFSKLMITVFCAAPLCILLVLRLENHIDASWWIIFMPIWIYLGWGVLSSTRLCCLALISARRSKKGVPPITSSSRSLSSGMTSTTISSAIHAPTGTSSVSSSGAQGTEQQSFATSSMLRGPSPQKAQSSPTTPDSAPVPMPTPVPAPTPSTVSVALAPGFSSPNPKDRGERDNLIDLGASGSGSRVSPAPEVLSLIQTPRRKRDNDSILVNLRTADASISMTPAGGVPSPTQTDNGERDNSIDSFESSATNSAMPATSTQACLSPVPMSHREQDEISDSVGPAVARVAMVADPPSRFITPIRTDRQKHYSDNDSFGSEKSCSGNPSPQLESHIQIDGYTKYNTDDSEGSSSVDSPVHQQQRWRSSDDEDSLPRLAPSSSKQNDVGRENLFISPGARSVTSSFASIESVDVSGTASVNLRRKEEAIMVQQQLSDMHRRYNEGTSMAKPNTATYNKVIIAWAKTGGKEAAMEAEKLLSNMHALHNQGDPDVKPNIVTYSAMIDAHVRSGEEHAANKADALLANMIQWYQADPVQNLDLLPNAYLFNTVISCWVKSNEHDAASKAEEMLVAMNHLHKSGLPNLKPNAFTYTAVIDAWTKNNYRGAAKRADKVLDEMEAKYVAGDMDLKPKTFVYSAVIHAHARGGEAGAAGRAERVLRKIVNMHQTGGSDDSGPTNSDFNTVLDLWAKNGGGRSSAEHAEEIVEWMGRLHKGGYPDVSPDTITFNAVLDAWARSDDRMAPDRAEQIVDHMDNLHRNGNTVVKPNTDTYNALIGAWARSGEKGAATRADQILSVMERRYRDGENGVKPNTRTYTSVIDAWAISGEKRAAKRAEQILNRMQALFDSSGDVDAKPNVHTVNAVCNACAFTQVEEDCAESLQIAFRVFDWLSSQPDMHPDSYTYTIMLSVCATLLPKDDRANRYAYARELFAKCSQSGYVNDYVLRKLRQTVTKEDYLSLVDYQDGTASSMPQEWTRNL